MPAPQSGEPEWIELYNYSNTAFILDFCFVCDAISCRQISKGTINPLSYLIITADTNFLLKHYEIPSVASFIQMNFPILNNNYDQVVLRNAEMIALDSTYYNMSYGKAGNSLERINIHQPALSQSNWAVPLGTINGTPGKENSNRPLDCKLSIHRFDYFNDTIRIEIKSNCNISKKYSLLLKLSKFHSERIEFEDILFDTDSSIQQNSINSYTFRLSELHRSRKKGRHSLFLRLDDLAESKFFTQSLEIDLGIEAFDIIINEIMFDPISNASEYIELYNNTQSYINLENWRIYDDAGSFNSKSLKVNHIDIAPFEYCVIAADSSIFNQFPNLQNNENLRIIKSSVVLNNSGDLIVLCDPIGNVIDSLHYTSKWHNQSISNTKGISLERISPLSESNDANSWTSSSGLRGGTPCEINTANYDTNKGSIEISPNPFNPSKHINCSIVFQIPFNNARLRAVLFDEFGNQVAEIANNRFVHSSGTLHIDSSILNMNNLRDGLYIVFVEAISTENGATHTNRAVLVIKN